MRFFLVFIPCLALSGISAGAAQLSLRYEGLRAPGRHDWQVLLQPDQTSAIAVEIGLQFSGGAILSVEPNVELFDDANPGQNPFTRSVTIGASIHSGGAAAFAALGGVVPNLQETIIMTIVTNGVGTLSLGGHDHNGFFTGARVWQGTSPVDGLVASLHVAAENADFNLDGVVDGDDFLIWQRGFGAASGASQAVGDANYDGAVDASDLAVWRNQYGTMPNVIAAPEPTGALSAVLGGGLLTMLLNLERRKNASPRALSAQPQ